MRTKALLCAAALAAGAATSMAQSNVYSLNVVGYYNVALPANTLVMLANQLNTTNNTIGSLLPSVPGGTFLYKYSGGFTVCLFDPDDLTWGANASITLNPGEGAFVKSPVATTLTFVGEVLQGSLTNTLPAGALAMRSSMVPQAGGVSTVLGVPAEGGDFLYKYSGGYVVNLFDPDDLTWGTEPTIGVGEAFFYKKAAAATNTKWIRNFTVQ